MLPISATDMTRVHMMPTIIHNSSSQFDDILINRNALRKLLNSQKKKNFLNTHSNFPYCRLSIQYASLVTVINNHIMSTKSRFHPSNHPRARITSEPFKYMQILTDK